MPIFPPALHVVEFCIRTLRRSAVFNRPPRARV
jgi:hypothetical protein